MFKQIVKSWTIVFVGTLTGFTAMASAMKVLDVVNDPKTKTKVKNVIKHVKDEFAK